MFPDVGFPVITLGGRQFWGDVCCFRGYRIQQHILSGHYRLLDPQDVRRAWGTLDECRQTLEAIQAEQRLGPLTGTAVILIHGIVRSSKSFGALARRLRQQGEHVIGFDYPSTQTTMAQSARFLQRTIASLDGIEQIDLVVHSMGGLLVRSYLQQQGDHPDPRLHRMVMLGVPNNGARMANLLQKNPMYRFIYGPAGQELIEHPEGYINSLPVPDFEFAIIAGARGTASGWNPFIPGDDDGTVSVEATRLPGAADFMTVFALHSFLMSQPAAMDATIRFLQTGALRANGQRQPIPATT